MYSIHVALTVNLFEGNAVVESLLLLVRKMAESIPYVEINPVVCVEASIVLTLA